MILINDSYAKRKCVKYLNKIAKKVLHYCRHASVLLAVLVANSVADESCL